MLKLGVPLDVAQRKRGKTHASASESPAASETLPEARATREPATMSATARASSDNVRHESVRAYVASLVGGKSALRFACVSKADGRLIAHAGVNSAHDAGDRIAAITSSTIALGETFAKEALRGRCDYSLISTNAGTIVVIRVPSRDARYILAVSSDSSEVVALTLRTAIDAANHIATIIESSEA